MASRQPAEFVPANADCVKSLSLLENVLTISDQGLFGLSRPTTVAQAAHAHMPYLLPQTHAATIWPGPMHAPTALPNISHAQAHMGVSAGASMGAIMVLVDRLTSWVLTWVLGHGSCCGHSVGSIYGCCMGYFNISECDVTSKLICHAVRIQA